MLLLSSGRESDLRSDVPNPDVRHKSGRHFFVYLMLMFSNGGLSETRSTSAILGCHGRRQPIEADVVCKVPNDV
jgi:hypothetical protein